MLPNSKISQDTALHAAIDKGHKIIVEELLANGADPNAVGDRKETPLHRAAYQNSADVIELLLAKGAKIDAVNNDSDNAIHVAARRGSVNAIETLLKHAPNQLTAKGRGGSIPFFVAVSNNQAKAAELFLSRGCDVNKIDLYSGLTALHIAASNDKPEMVSLLLDKSEVEVDIEDRQGYTPLQRCAMQRNPSLKAAKVLIEHKAQVNTDDENESPLSLLVRNIHPRASSTLLEFTKLLISEKAKTDYALEVLTARKNNLSEADLAVYDYLKSIPTSSTVQKSTVQKP